MDWTPLVTPIIVAIVAATPGIISLIQQRKKQSVEAADLIQRASGELIEQYKRRMDEMEEQAAANEEEVGLLQERFDRIEQDLRKRDNDLECRDQYIEHLLRGIRRLIAQIKSLDTLPVWSPKPKSAFEICDDDNEFK